jgi:hypothetical protein
LLIPKSDEKTQKISISIEKCCKVSHRGLRQY